MIFLVRDYALALLNLVKDKNEHWRTGDEIEQIGVVSQEVIDLLAAVIKEVRS